MKKLFLKIPFAVLPEKGRENVGRPMDGDPCWDRNRSEGTAHKNFLCFLEKQGSQRQFRSLSSEPKMASLAPSIAEEVGKKLG